MFIVLKKPTVSLACFVVANGTMKWTMAEQQPSKVTETSLRCVTAEVNLLSQPDGSASFNHGRSCEKKSLHVSKHDMALRPIVEAGQFISL